MAELNHSFGVTKPVGHVMISFPSAEQAQDTRLSITSVGVSHSAVRSFSDRDMAEQLESDLRAASPVASIGQEVNLAKAQLELARRGYHFLIVRVDNDEQARQVAECARARGAERAQHYGHFMIEELIEHGDELTQVAESPDRGLDSQTPTGREAQRAASHSGKR